MPRIEPLPREELAEFEPFFALVESSMGFVPNSMLTMGRVPELLRAFAGLSGTVIGGGTLDPGLKQLVALVSSSATGCRYCQAHTAHTAELRGVDAAKLDAVFAFDDSPLFSDAEKAALSVARAASFVPNETSDAMFDELKRHYSEAEIVEIMGVIALFGWLNRWNDSLATALEQGPLTWANERLAPHDWSAGKHG